MVCRDAVELVSDYLDALCLAGTDGAREAPRAVRRVHGLPGSVRATIAASGAVNHEDLPSDVVEGLVNCSVISFRQLKGPCHGVD